MSSHSDSFVYSGNSPATEPDFYCEDYGSVVLLRPLSESARLWIEEHICKENGYQPNWPTVLIEPRYIAEIIRGAQSDGLRVASR